MAADRDGHPCRLSVFDGVADGFLCNLVELDGGIGRQRGKSAFDRGRAGDAEHFLHVLRQVLQHGGKIIAADVEGTELMREVVRVINQAFHQLANLAGFLGAGMARARQALLEAPDHERHSRQFLAEIVVQIETDASPFILGNLEQFVKMKSVSEIEATDKHIVNAVEFLFRYAFDQRASDIHIEPKRDASEVRLRIDGMLNTIHRTPKAVHSAFISRIKMLSRMDIAEKRRPQDGRIKTEYKSREVELRVSTMPTAFGEKVVIRIFDPDILLQDLEEIGFSPREYELFRSFIARPNGIILVTGPTGSGKTTTLYSALKTVATPEVNVVTIEDPVEMVHDKFNQVSIQPQIGVTFGSTLRTILRQDPDIIMVGEVRDLETAENAVQAALTGHLVFSTLHTNDAPSTITRLMDLGVPSYLIASTIIGVMGQRLVRKICKHCEKSYELLPEEAQAVGLLSGKDRKVSVKYGEGCPQCRGTGYQGRTAIFEVMEMNDRIRAIIHDKSDAETIRKAAVADGMVGLREAAVMKMLKGETTFDEVIRVTGEKL